MIQNEQDMKEDSRMDKSTDRKHIEKMMSMLITSFCEDGIMGNWKKDKS